MRLLHTSDWHIGRSLHGADLLADQERVLTGLAELIIAEAVDVVVVACDIYDRAIPPAAATAVLLGGHSPADRVPNLCGQYN